MLPFGTSDYYAEQTFDMLADEGYSYLLLVKCEPYATSKPRSQQAQLISRCGAIPSHQITGAHHWWGWQRNLLQWAVER
jgi:hypothetical protein